ncbi:unnamed protein product [Eruca vesicaria subsp. sativa]|uniref:Uncharacterized protein n=1 Tax=Eruca vesicaria subsp. sativa TaxID=29727 RepID=A0ABC8KUS0_ERUVS|nr:unnamed protein product [Eruca vesicaria subsp. sativa]
MRRPMHLILALLITREQFRTTNQQSAKQILSKPPTQQPSVLSPLAGDEFSCYSHLEFSNKKEQLDLGELDWLAEMGFSGEQPDQEALLVAETPSFLMFIPTINPLNPTFPTRSRGLRLVMMMKITSVVHCP